MEAGTRQIVRRRASDHCEYCLLNQKYSDLIHHIEHIVARQHGGSDDIGNLALACHRCNLRKGPNLAGIDPVTSAVAPLFHPRLHGWTEHFAWRDVHIEGFTATGPGDRPSAWDERRPASRIKGGDAGRAVSSELRLPRRRGGWHRVIAF